MNCKPRCVCYEGCGFSHRRRVQGRVCANADEIQIFRNEHLLVIRVARAHAMFVSTPVARLGIHIAQRDEGYILQASIRRDMVSADAPAPNDPRL